MYLSKSRFKQTVTESKSRSREFVHDGGVALLVVAIIEAVSFQAELVQVDGVPTENTG